MARLKLPAEPLRVLLERFDAATSADAVAAASVSLNAALASNTDPWGVLGYLAALGNMACSLDDLLLINDVADEEELFAHRVAEGVVITVASEGEWLLFRP